MPIVIDIIEGEKSRSFKLSNNPLSIGRGEDCDIVVSDPNCSKLHCEVKINTKIASIKDLGSKNGTLINGEAVGEGHLYIGHEAKIGKVIIRINPSHLDTTEKEFHTFNPGRSQVVLSEINMSEEKRSAPSRPKEYTPEKKSTASPLKKVEVSKSQAGPFWQKILNFFNKR